VNAVDKHTHNCPAREMSFDCTSPGPREAFAISVLSLVLTTAAAAAGIVLALRLGSTATLGFGLENLVDCVSSLLVAWRFWGGGEGTNEHMLALREERAAIGIALCFVLLAIVVGGAALMEVLTGHDAEPPGGDGEGGSALLLLLTAPSAAIFAALGLLKLHIGAAVDSASLKEDGTCTLAGALLSLGVCVGVGLVSVDPSLWWADAVVALVVAAALLLHGGHTLLAAARRSKAWWRKRFWKLRGFVPFPQEMLERHDEGERPDEKI